jgi:hypothetical protein
LIVLFIDDRYEMGVRRVNIGEPQCVADARNYRTLEIAKLERAGRAHCNVVYAFWRSRQIHDLKQNSARYDVGGVSSLTFEDEAASASKPIPAVLSRRAVGVEVLNASDFGLTLYEADAVRTVQGTIAVAHGANEVAQTLTTEPPRIGVVVYEEDIVVAAMCLE